MEDQNEPISCYRAIFLICYKAGGSTSSAREGVIKYKPFRVKSRGFDFQSIDELDWTRNELFYHKLIGQDSLREGGVGFGNVSQRVDERFGKFVITSTQTGDTQRLNRIRDYAVVTTCDVDKNKAWFYGGIDSSKASSSESMTHDAVYECDPEIQFVLHGHVVPVEISGQPSLWDLAGVLKVPCTARGIEYGTPEMARDIKRVFEETDVREKRIIAMLGHRNGIITFGETAEEAAEVMLKYLDEAREFLGSSGF